MVQDGLTSEELLLSLEENHSIKVSQRMLTRQKEDWGLTHNATQKANHLEETIQIKRTLKRKLHQMQLSQRLDDPNQNLVTFETAVSCIVALLQTPKGQNVEYHRLQQLLQTQYGITLHKTDLLTAKRSVQEASQKRPMDGLNPQPAPTRLSMESDNRKATRPFVDWQLDRHTVWICSVSIGCFTLKAPVGRSMEASSGRFEIKAPVGSLMAASNGRYLTGAPTGRFMVASNGHSCQVAPTGCCHQASKGRFNLKVPTGRFHGVSNGRFQGEAANGRSGSHCPTGASPRLRPADALEASVGHFYQKASSGQAGF
ncbi:hypothetical protein PCASD_09582 [Puccinia coronata f. sp. avenae]|uniref:Uncharacterized protein n=1 Tax=Puccinia coronata f. sp. avenae TaxID=200324 RepID=A0A2N5V2A7_9BASI|nr:hypothetical protein PCASD_09582 [Puccinia coronata f. sp. avenae]